MSISTCTVNAEFDRILQAELQQNAKSSYSKLLSLCFHASALASQTDENDAQAQLVSLIRQLGSAVNITLGPEISNIAASPIVSTMVDRILQLANFGAMDVLDKLDTVPATPQVVVETLVSELLNHLFTLSRRPARAQSPVPTPPPPASAQQTLAQQISNPKFFAHTGTNNTKATPIMHHSIMQSIARLPLVMGQINSLNGIGAEQLFDILIDDDLAPEIPLVIFCGGSSGGQLASWDYLIGLRNEVIQYAAEYIDDKHTASLKEIAHNSNLLLGLQFAASGIGNLFPYAGFLASINRSAAYTGSTTEEQVAKAANLKSPPTNIFGDKTAIQLWSAELMQLFYLIARPYDPGAKRIIQEYIIALINEANAINNNASDTVVLTAIPAVVKALSPGNTTLNAVTSVLTSARDPTRYLFQRVNMDHVIDKSKPLKLEAPTILHKTYQNLQTDAQRRSLRLMVNECHDNNLNSSSSYHSRHHHKNSQYNGNGNGNGGSSGGTNYSHNSNTRGRYKNQQSMQGTGQLAPAGNNQRLCNPLARSGSAWVPISEFEHRGSFPYKVRPGDITTSYARGVQNALEDFVSKKSLRVNNGRNGITTICPMGFHLPSQGKCNCDARHINTRPWTEAQRQNEIKHLSGAKNNDKINISAHANSDIPQRR